MSRIDDIFARLRAEGRVALMPFLTAGFPSLEVTAQAIPALERAGATLIEIGFPFSDPIADGPVIASSMHEALLGGTTPERVFEAVSRVRPRVQAGLVAMVSDSIICRVGPESFVDQAADAGFDGLIVPDIDLEDAESLAALATARGLTFTLLVAPTTSEDRLERIARTCTGFIYLLARVGLTGERGSAPKIEDRVALVRRHTDLPVAVGFGISTAAHVASVASAADGVIVGSALVRRMGESEHPVRAAADFVAGLAQGLPARANPA